MRLFFVLTLMFCLCVSLPGMASEALVKSEVAVDVTDKDPAEARDKALAKGQMDALAELLGKLAPPEQVQVIMASMDNRKVAAIVRGTEVLEEKMTADRYRAELRVSFDANAISELVGAMPTGEEASNAAVTTSTFLILPVFEDGTETYLWEERNPWRNVWRSVSLEVNTGEIIVPYGDGTDISIAKPATIGSATYAMLAPLAVRYGVSDMVVVTANFKRTPNMTITVVLRRINRLKNEVNMLNYRADPGETRDMLLMRAANDIATILQDRKVKEREQLKEIRGGDHSQVMVLASITTLNSWTDLRARLAKLPMVDKIELLAMSPQQVDMVLHYRGTAPSLASAINAQKIRLVENEQYWVISGD